MRLGAAAQPPAQPRMAPTVLQLAPDTPSEFPQPGFGKVTRINADGSLTDVVTGLSVPTAMTFGPDGKLYISNFGAAPAGAGQIVKATVQ